MIGTVGELVDTLGVDYSLPEGSLAAGAVVLLKVIDAEGGVTLSICNSDGLSWIEKIGMLNAAAAIEMGNIET